MTIDRDFVQVYSLPWLEVGQAPTFSPLFFFACLLLYRDSWGYLYLKSFAMHTPYGIHGAKSCLIRWVY